jgi:hypothetical protein
VGIEATQVSDLGREGLGDKEGHAAHGLIGSERVSLTVASVPWRDVFNGL